MVRVQTTAYRDQLDSDTSIDVQFRTVQAEVSEYAVVLLTQVNDRLRAVRLYDNAHGGHDMHRYTYDGVKQRPETFHRGSASAALQSAIGAVRSGYSEMIESWRR